MNNFHSNLSRRKFITLAGMAAVATPFLANPSYAAQKRQLSPSERIHIAMIGVGGMGTTNMKALLGLPDCQIIAACDLDANHLKTAINTINNKYQNKDCKGYNDFHELIDRDDIDAVVISVPDHSHAWVAIAAANKGKDIYSEKPLARTLFEQHAIVKAVQKNNIIWQTGSWQRSKANFHKAAEIVRNGLIGQVTRVEVGLPSGNGNNRKYLPEAYEVSPPPEVLDYEHWVGPSKMIPYRRALSHKEWRWNYNFGGGQIMDWVGHHADIALWGLGFDATQPLEVGGAGEFPPQDAVWNTATQYRVECKYPQNITMTIAGGYDDIKSGTKWIGTEGWVYVDRNKFDASNDEWNDYKTLPDNLAKIKLYKSNDHHKNFLDCIRSRKPTITPVKTANNSTTPGHLGLIAMLTRRKIKWNSATQQIIDDKEANALLTRPFRDGYTID